MTTPPEPGWYTDASDSTRHRYWDGVAWTEWTRSAEEYRAPAVEVAPPARTGGRVVAIVAIAVLGIGAVVAAILLLTGGPSTKGIVANDTIGWVRQSALSEAVTFSIDPGWEDISDPGMEASFSASMGSAMGSYSYTLELSGVWLVSGSQNDGTVFLMMAMNVGVDPSDLESEARSTTGALAYGLPDYSEILSESATTNSGDAAWRVDFSASQYGERMNGSFFLVVDENTTVICEAVSTEDFDVWLGDFLAMSKTVSLG
jgi:type II secretory pathway pseudopilin PulG